jgi:drug/metabolite transporter (DMT)-like permease
MTSPDTPSSAPKKASLFEHRSAKAERSVQSVGIFFIMLAVTAFSLMDAIAKYLGTQVDVSQILWARYTGQLVVLLIIFGPKLRQHLHTSHPVLQILRSLMQLTAAACFFIALKENDLSEATAVADLAPVLITLAAAVVLKERVGPRRLFGVSLALLGALIVIRPGAEVFSTASLWPLGTAASLAGYAIITRYMGPSESPITALLYSAVICALIMNCITPFRWVPPTSFGFLLLACLAAIGTFAQFMMVKAYTEADASAIAPFSYVGLFTATVWGFLFFGDVPDLWTCVGALVIVSAGLYVWSRERYLAKQP